MTATPDPVAVEPSDDRGGDPSSVGDCALYEDGGRRAGKLSLDEAGDAARDTDGFVWIGLQQPSAEEVEAIADRFGLPALAVEDAVKAHQRPKVELYEGCTFVVLKPARYIDHEEIVEVSEIALFVGEHFVVTVRHGDSDILARVRTELDEGSDVLQHGPVAVLYRTVDLVVDGYEDTIDLINDDVDEIEIQVFGDDEQNHAERIYKLKREIAQFRRAVLPLASPMQRLVESNVPPVDPAVTPFFRDVYDHLLRSIDAIEGHDRLLSDVLQADLARLGVRQSEIGVRQNEDMRKISAWAAIGLLPTAVAGIYGMNFEHMPELETRYGYFVVLAAVAAACFALYRQFRRRGWL